LYESDEFFYMNLSAAHNATIVDNQGIGTIRNDDPQPAFSINDVSQAEGNAGTSSFVFTVSLSNASPSTLTVNIATADGSAAAPGDYTATSGTLTFTSGQLSKTATVSVVGDTTNEPDETFTLNLSGNSAG